MSEEIIQQLNTEIMELQVKMMSQEEDFEEELEAVRKDKEKLNADIMDLQVQLMNKDSEWEERMETQVRFWSRTPHILTLGLSIGTSCSRNIAP